MTGDNSPITDSDLHAYADGLLDAGRRAEVERHLVANPVLADDVGYWKRQSDTLHELYSHIGRETPPPRLSAHHIAQRMKRQTYGRWRMAAAAILLATAGVMAGWFLRDVTQGPLASSSLVNEAFAAHSLYTREVLHPVEVRGDQEAHLATWLSKRLDRPLVIPNLRADGLSLVGGRLLPASGGAAAQFMYEDDGGRRVTLYIVPMQNGRETSLRHVATGALESFAWTEETVGCALVGDLPRERLHEIAVRAYRQLS
ncbi:anti-sigma factor family protein [Aquamicrobium ahrensii]|uniref:Anti-sigma factor RsiW n=1 Tax=Aquamicrobium ahrensii TaxID=469551 RepID=A0ABV2KIW6_9HYPH